MSETSTDPVQLTRRRRRLEEHHVAGRANDANLLAVLCLNCHASVSERQRDAGLFNVSEPTNVLERLARILVSLATFAEALAVTLRARAQELFDLIASLELTMGNEHVVGKEAHANVGVIVGSDHRPLH